MLDEKYGVLIGKVVGLEADSRNEDTPHYNLIIKTKNEEEFSAHINCQSNDDKYSQVLYYIDNDCHDDITDSLMKLDEDFHEINYAQNLNSQLAIDYIRSGLVSRDDMKTIPYDIEGENDLKAYIDQYMKKSLKNVNSSIYIFGDCYDGKSGKGIHNIHMNQGNRGSHYQRNKIYSDGCFFIHLIEEEQWIAYYLAFQNQSWSTNESGCPQD